MGNFIKDNFLLFTASILSFILMGGGQSMMGPALPEFRTIFGLSIASVSVIVTAQWVGALIGVIFLYFASGRDWLRPAFALLTIGAALMALMPGWPLTIIGSFCFGAGYGATLALVNSRLLAAFGNYGPSMISLVNALFGGGAIVAPLLFVALGRSPQIAFGLLAVMLLIVLGFSLRLPTVRGKSDTGARAKTFRPSLSMLFVGASGTGIEACLIGFGPVILARSGLTETAAAGALSLFFVFFLTGRLVLSYLGNKLPAAPMLLAGFAGGAVMLSLAASGIAAQYTYALSGFFIGSLFPNFFVLGSKRLGDDHRTGPALVGAALAGGVTGPLIIGQLIEKVDPLTPFWILAGYALCIVLVGAVVFGRRDTTQPA
ncbi:MAG TPA: MFS transporter [Paenirhodobacter sp.]